MDKTVKAALVQYPNSNRNYEFLTIFEDLKFGDIVIVADKNDFSPVEFIKYQDEIKYANNWIVDKINKNQLTSIKKDLDKLLSMGDK